MDKETSIKELGARLREIRKAKNMSQKELANAIEKDQQSIQRLEAGNMNPTYIYLSEIAKGLGVTLSELLKDL